MSGSESSASEGKEITTSSGLQYIDQVWEPVTPRRRGRRSPFITPAG